MPLSVRYGAGRRTNSAGDRARSVAAASTSCKPGLSRVRRPRGVDRGGAWRRGRRCRSLDLLELPPRRRSGVYERRLGVRTGLAIDLVPGRPLRLELGLACGQSGIAASCIATRRPVVPLLDHRDDDTQMMRAAPIAPPHQPLAMGQRRLARRTTGRSQRGGFGLLVVQSTRHRGTMAQPSGRRPRLPPTRCIART